MPIVTDRTEVLALFSRAQERGWVIPAFGTENLTTTEAILTGALRQAEALHAPDFPVMVAATNQYSERSQTSFYTHTRNWRVGLELLLADLAVLTAPASPFGRLQVLIHLDHIQHDLDQELWAGDLSRFSSIMFDASTLPLVENIAATRRFVQERGSEIVVEGACDYIGGRESQLTDVREAERFLRETNVDWMVPNLGTEHRAGVSELHYARDLARQIADRIGPRLVLHGTSSVAPEQLAGLAEDGVTKVNLWTALERDAAAVLLREMVRDAGKNGGVQQAEKLREEGLLGPQADVSSPASLAHFPTAARQHIVFEQMQNQVFAYLQIWCPGLLRV